MTTQNQIEKTNIASSGANSDITSMSGLTGPLQAPTAVQSSTGLNLLAFSYIASSVNYITVQNNITGANPALFASGSDSNITFQIQGKGTGGVYLGGTGTNDNAVSGQVGEYKETVVLSASQVSLTTATAANVITLSLTAGDWDVSSEIWFAANASTVTTQLIGEITTSSATLTAIPNSARSTVQVFTPNIAGSGGVFALKPCRISLSTTTNVYLVGYAVFAVNSMGAYGILRARRIR